MAKTETERFVTDEAESAEAPAAPVSPAETLDSEPSTQSESVYRRIDPSPRLQRTPGRSLNIRTRARELAPTVVPLLIGFALLLSLIFIIGYLSAKKMDALNQVVLELEAQHAARLSLVLRLRLAVTKLNNEARARHEAESRDELKPPFAFALSMSRDDVIALARELERPPLTEEKTWSEFHGALTAYIEVTRDLRRFSLEGRSKFDAVDALLDQLLMEATAQQDQILAESTRLEREAVRSIELWTTIALIVGALVAAATIWEVQRWFRRMRISMLEASRERAFTTQLIEGMVSAVAAIDENDRIRSANASFFKIFPAASIGASVHESFGPADAMKMLEAVTLNRVDTASYLGRWITRVDGDATEKSFDIYSSPLAIDGDRGQIVTLVDVTEAAEAERVLRRSESLAAVGRATTQVAHEIRNPLGSIRLGVSMLRDSVNDPEALRTIELVERGIKHLNKLVVDVTQFSRQKALERTEVDLHDLLERSLDLVADRVKEKQTPVERQFLGRRLVGEWDGDQLRQVFVNVIANAVDASTAKMPLTIETRVVRHGTSENGGRSFAQVTVIDQGSGMDQSTLDRIFEPFFTTKKRGTGLGLAIVKQIVEQHGGNIHVDSEVGEGSRFIIQLPL
ncbi:MAG TPA: ATP-binding protein [Pyrinomonadaceae bacterium]|nr:ATP-binding protein [Pyrinomonadaceae bacterium]